MTAEEIVRALAADDAPTREDGRGVDYCQLCSSDLPWGVVSQRQHGAKCLSCGRTGRLYTVGDLSPCCGVSCVPNMLDVKGILRGLEEYHDKTCPWRTAREWVAEHGRGM